jgi:hypothetical protein
MLPDGVLPAPGRCGLKDLRQAMLDSAVPSDLSHSVGNDPESVECKRNIAGCQLRGIGRFYAYAPATLTMTFTPWCPDGWFASPKVRLSSMKSPSVSDRRISTWGC